jgi:hypothetical protein
MSHVAMLLALCALASSPTLGLVDGVSGPFVKFRYHGQPRVKCMNCKIRGTNVAPELIGDGVVCAPVPSEESKWDCEVPKPVKRFRVCQNNTQLEVVINPTAALTVFRAPESLASKRYTETPPPCADQEQSWWSSLGTVVWLFGFVVGKLTIGFLRGPVSGHLTNHWLQHKKKS